MGRDVLDPSQTVLATNGERTIDLDADWSTDLVRRRWDEKWGGGMMTAPVRVSNSDREATARLDDGAFLAHCLIQGMRLVIALLTKRWPELK